MIYLLLGMICFFIGVILSSVIYIKIICRINGVKLKLVKYYQLFDQWLLNYERGIKVEDYFLTNGYKCIAIYGMKEFGLHLLNELKDSKVTVEYAIDKNLSIIPAGVVGYGPGDELPKVDAIVVTASYYFSEIKEQLKNNDCDIVSIDDVVCCIY